MWTAVCIWSLSTENWLHAVWELKKWSVREREHLYQQDSTYHALTNFNWQRIVTPGKNRISGHPVPNPSGAEVIVSDR